MHVEVRRIGPTHNHDRLWRAFLRQLSGLSPIVSVTSIASPPRDKESLTV
jgi:hypothetical protein